MSGGDTGGPADIAHPLPEQGRPGRSGSIAVFVTTAFAITWAIWAPILVQVRTDGTDTMPWTYFLASAGPAAAAVAATGRAGGAPALLAWLRRIFAWRLPPRWWAAAVGMPVGYFLVAWTAAALITGHWPDLSAFGRTEKLPGLAWPGVAVVWALTFGLGEEAGWRGWLLPALSRRMPAFWATLGVAGVWIAWHLPAFFFNPTYRAMGAGVVGWMFALACGSYLLSWMTLGAGGSILPVLLWHAGFDLLTAADQSSGVIASTVSAVVMAQGMLCAWLLWHDRRRQRP